MVNSLDFPQTGDEQDVQCGTAKRRETTKTKQQKPYHNHSNLLAMAESPQEGKSYKELIGSSKPCFTVEVPKGMHPLGKAWADLVSTAKLGQQLSTLSAADTATKSQVFPTHAPWLGPGSHPVCLEQCQGSPRVFHTPLHNQAIGRQSHPPPKGGAMKSQDVPNVTQSPSTKAMSLRI